jgi:hypothetical protein
MRDHIQKESLRRRSFAASSGCSKALIAARAREERPSEGDATKSSLHSFSFAARILERQKMLRTGQVLLWRLSVDFALVLPFKDSQGGTSTQELSDFKKNSLHRHASEKKQPQDADRAKAFATPQSLRPAISEAAEPRCSTPIAINLPDTPRRSEAPPR